MILKNLLYFINKLLVLIYLELMKFNIFRIMVKIVFKVNVIFIVNWLWRFFIIGLVKFLI